MCACEHCMIDEKMRNYFPNKKQEQKINTLIDHNAKLMTSDKQDFQQPKKKQTKDLGIII